MNPDLTCACKHAKWRYLGDEPQRRLVGGTAGRRGLGLAQTGDVSSAKKWLIAAGVALALGVWGLWAKENPALLNGDYRCTGSVVHPDGSRSAIDASAEVVGGKIRPGQTGADLALGRQVLDWGTVKKVSGSEFLIELTPRAEIATQIAAPFWITCQYRR